MRIKRVIEADFRRADLGIWLEFTNTKRNRVYTNRAFIQSLRTDDVVVFVSKGGNQLLFVHGFENLRTEAGDERVMLPSVRYRIVKGTWSPYMLSVYAKAANMPITGLKTFEQHFPVKDRTVRKAA
jgi:hypothetical protein